MVAQKYRWDFIGLSTDEKPTAATSPKVTDGSTFYCSDNSKLYVWYNDRWYERKALGGGGGGGTSYTAGYGIDIDDDTISIDTTTIHSVEYVDLTVTNITSSEITVTPSKTPTEVNTWVSAGKEVVYRLTIAETVPGFAAGTYLLQTVMAGSTGVIASSIATPDTISTRGYIFGQGINQATGTIYVKNLDVPAVVQTTGTSTTDVMSQKAVTDALASAGGDTVYSDKTTSTSASGGAVYIGNLNSSQVKQSDPTTTDNHYKYFWALPNANSNVPANYSVNIMGRAASPTASHFVAIGEDAAVDGSYAASGVAIGQGSYAVGNRAVALGGNTNCANAYSVALGGYAKTSRVGEVNVGAGTSGTGYNSTNYRVIGGVHDGQLAQDAVTVNQVNSVIDAINTALSTNIPHIGA